MIKAILKDSAPDNLFKMLKNPIYKFYFIILG
jgi:hypothetical protein